MSDKTINLAKRQVRVTNLNFSPERNGEDKVPRVDLSMEVLLEHEDIGQLLLSDPNSLVDGAALHEMWDEEGIPRFRIDDMRLPVKVTGFARLGLVKAKKPVEFENAVLKKCVLELMMGWKAKLRCQVRVDPSGNAQLLEDLAIMEEAQFSYNGSALPAEGDENQTEMNV